MKNAASNRKDQNRLVEDVRKEGEAEEEEEKKKKRKGGGKNRGRQMIGRSG